MKCPECGFRTAKGMKFCGNCSARLDLFCPQCNSPNPPNFKFCGQCGHSLNVIQHPGGQRILSFDEKLARDPALPAQRPDGKNPFPEGENRG